MKKIGLYGIVLPGVKNAAAQIPVNCPARDLHDFILPRLDTCNYARMRKPQRSQNRTL